MSWYIGVDPGIQGGIALISDEPEAIDWLPMPHTVAGIITGITDMVDQCKANEAKAVLVTELAQPMPKQGSVSGFNYGRGFGAIEVICCMLSVPYHEVRANIWKKALRVGSVKLTSIRECERLFPKVDLVLPRCKVPNDGIAEALLIAEWGRRMRL